MKRKVTKLFIIILYVIQFVGCDKIETIVYEDGFESIRLENEIGIARKPNPANYSDYFKILDELPITTNEEENIECDLRCSDLTNLDLSDEFEYLTISDFDDYTVWPSADKLPKMYDIDKIKEYGKDPGLNIRKIHDNGITGKGIGIAIIDQNTLVDHIEYKDNLKHYEEIHMFPNKDAYMHGPMVDSIAVGKTVGVAPGADLYHFSTGTIEILDNDIKTDLQWFSVAVDRVIEINKMLNNENKIRVISFSHGITERMKNYKIAFSAIERARKENIAIFYISDSNDHMVNGLGRNILESPNVLDSYEINYYLHNLDSFGLYDRIKNEIFVPIDARCVASRFETDKYEFQFSGGYSNVPPYVAGLYVLCLEVNSEIDIDEFYEILDRTASNVVFKDGNTYKIANPLNMIEDVKNKSNNSGESNGK